MSEHSLGMCYTGKLWKRKLEAYFKRNGIPLDNLLMVKIGAVVERGESKSQAKLMLTPLYENFTHGQRIYVKDILDEPIKDGFWSKLFW